MLMLLLLATEPLACQNGQCARPAAAKVAVSSKPVVSAGKRVPVLKFGSKIRKK